MYVHAIIETEEAYRIAQADVLESREKWVWYTTSPWLLEKLAKAGESVRSLEEGVTQQDINTVGEASLSISRHLRDYLDGHYRDWSSGMRPGKAIGTNCYRMLSTLLYKVFLLSRWITMIGAQHGNKAFIYGDPALSHAIGFRVTLPRFATLYAALADNADLPGWIKIMPYKSCEGGKQLDLMNRISLWDRLFSLINYDPSVVFYRLWYFFTKGRPISFPFRKKVAQLWVYKDNTLIREVALWLFLRGAELRKIVDSDIKVETDTNQSNPADLIEFLKQELSEHAAQVQIIPGLLQRLNEIASERIARAMECGKKFAWNLNKKLDEHDLVCGNGREGNIFKAVLSNCLSAPGERILHQLLRYRNIPAIEFDHGVSAGLSAQHVHISDFLPTQSCDGLAAYNDNSLHFFEQESVSCPKRGIVTGVPRQQRKIPFGRLQKILIRKRLKVSSGCRIVIYVMTVYQNNEMHNPHGTADLAYHQFRKRIITEVFPALPDQFIAKLYPTYRYVDPDPFVGPIDVAPNTKVIQFTDFRYWRSCADVLIVDAPLSTLGWAWAVGAPLIFLDRPSNPLLNHVAKEFDRALFRIDCNKADWSKELEGLLRLPHHELLSQWNEKYPIRRKVDEYYVSGNRNKTGSQVAQDLLGLAKTLAEMKSGPLEQGVA
ncbi:hypothetical protein ACFL6Y_04360 [Elusimicrobiota bacterium]